MGAGSILIDRLKAAMQHQAELAGFQLPEAFELRVFPLVWDGHNNAVRV